MGKKKRKVIESNTPQNNGLGRIPGETIWNYLKRILTNSRIIIFLTIVGLVISSIPVYFLLKPKPEEIVIKEKIFNNLTDLKSELSQNNFISKKDSSEYGLMLINMRNLSYDYISLWKAVSTNEKTASFANLPLEEVELIEQSEVSMRRKLGDVAENLFQQILDIQIYECLTDSSRATALSQSKQREMLTIIEEMRTRDSIHVQNILLYRNKINDNIINEVDKQKLQENKLAELDAMKTDLIWLRFHEKFSHFIFESYSLFSSSYRYYSTIKPYSMLDSLIYEEFPNLDDEDMEEVREWFISQRTKRCN